MSHRILSSITKEDRLPLVTTNMSPLDFSLITNSLELTRGNKLRTDIGMQQQLLKNPSIFKNAIYVPSLFYLHRQESRLDGAHPRSMC